jgi:DNA-binding response OmpR family regulator
MLPEMDGMEVLRRIRRFSSVPVLMLTARGEEPDRIAGLDLGADDYLPKTMSSQELVARLRAVIRRSNAGAPGGTPLEPSEMLEIGPLRIHAFSRSVTLRGEALHLTPVEFDLLWNLGRSAGRLKTREELLGEIRQRHYEVFDRSIDVHISALRKKLGDDPKSPRFIRTVRSAGYILIAPDAPPLL